MHFWKICLLFVLGASATARAEGEVVMHKGYVKEGGRTYMIAYPSTLDPGKPVPLIVGFHGYRGDVKTWLHEETRFTQLMAKEPFIMVFPEGPVSWSTEREGKDVKFFDDLVLDLKNKYPIDAGKVYVVGHSNGANFASFLLLARPQTVAAGVAHSGIYPADRFPAQTTSAPLMVVWGEKDHMAPAAELWVQNSVQSYENKGVPVTMVVVPGGGHPWASKEHQIEEKILAFLFGNKLQGGKKTAESSRPAP